MTSTARQAAAAMPPSGSALALPLPLPLRAWTITRRLGRFRGQARVAVTMAPRLLDAGVPYRGADGLVFRIDPEDDLQVLILLGMHDRAVVRELRRHATPGSVVIDAGAHIGYFTLHAAGCVGAHGQVHSFECDPRVAPELREHVRLNEVPQVTVVERAISDAPGELQLRLLGRFGLSTTHAGINGGGKEVSVPAQPLDDYLVEADIDPGRISVIKVDVEGAEPAALRGMRRALEQSRAAVIVEIDPARAIRTGESPDAIFELLADLGRQPARVLAPRGSGRSALSALRSGDTDVAADVLFLPAEPQPSSR
jgi:FkbM family methyltransferase